MTRIIQASTAHIRAIHALAHRIWPLAFADILSKEQIAYMLGWMYAPESLRQQMQKGHQFLVMKEKGRYTGFCSFEHQDKFTKLHKIYLLPQVQGTGRGKTLLQEVINSAKNNNRQAIRLNVNRYNKAVDFYKRAGFGIIKEEDNAIGQGYFMNDFVMELKLV